MWAALGVYLLLVNLLAFAAMLRDKRAAKRGRRRTPEATLMWIAAAGGAPGTLLAMYTVRHKTRKVKFAVGVPLLLLTHIALAILLWLWTQGLLTVV